MTLTSTAQSLTPGTPVELFRLDATPVGASVYYFVQAAKTNGTSISFGGQIYQPIDIKVSDFESNAGGSLPMPTMQIANSDMVIQALVNLYGDLGGCELRRVRTFAQYLDGEPTADPTAYIGPDVFSVEQKTDENPDYIEWKLSASFDQEGKMLPGRQYLRDVCTRRYRRYDPSNPQAHPDGFVYPTVHPCPYTASPSFTAKGEPTTAVNDRCGRKDSDCRLRFGTEGIMPFGGFPGIARVRQQ